MSEDKDIIDVTPVGESGDKDAESLKTIGWISYGLHFVVALAAVLPGTQVGLGLLLIALIIDLVKQSDAEGTWQATHFSWRIRSVIWAGVLYVVTLPLWFVFVVPGMIAWIVVSIWFLYRIIKGALWMKDSRPMPS
ncbi:hypothetical protein [Hydrogenophaga sp. 5NK40-0174]|uniref:DUF4870 family protein n=1 Tax=Hydrogenophaga sp. 5NK40-0174 TaxID=3127649 RepID=UPI00310A92FB